MWAPFKLNHISLWNMDYIQKSLTTVPCANSLVHTEPHKKAKESQLVDCVSLGSLPLSIVRFEQMVLKWASSKTLHVSLLTVMLHDFSNQPLIRRKPLWRLYLRGCKGTHPINESQRMSRTETWSQAPNIRLRYLWYGHQMGWQYVTEVLALSYISSGSTSGILWSELNQQLISSSVS